MKKLALLTFSALMLAACGSGGGGSDENAQPSTGSTTTPAKPSKPDTAKPNNNGGNQPGKPAASNSNAHSLVSGNGSNTLSFPDAAKIRKIKVNGKTFDLTTVDFGAKVNDDWRVSSPNFLIKGKAAPQGIKSVAIWTGSQNATAGVIQTEGSDQRYGFFNGKPTNVAELPKGKVTYHVSVISTKPNGLSLTQTNIAADFAAKKLSGTVGNIALKADIKGNRFESAAGAATEVKGGFFGKNAAEVAGAFKNGDTVGAFGGGKK
ncbi:MAG: transferrin-binding protein-like solute binding protein [Neisseria sp.]|nr:transferrin-binding protein-like solute binding protein [Neisseria sp.]